MLALLVVLAAAPRIDYTIRYDPSAAARALDVQVDIHDLPADATEIEVEVGPWGEWHSLDVEYVSALHIATAHKTSTIEDGRFRVFTPVGAPRDLAFSYRLAAFDVGSSTIGDRPLLPACAATYCRLFSENTLASIAIRGAYLLENRTLRVNVPRGFTVDTGWGDARHKRIPLDPRLENGVIVFGTGRKAAQKIVEGRRYRVVQYDPGPDLTRATLADTLALCKLFGAVTQFTPSSGVSIFLAKAGPWGTATQNGIHLTLDLVEGNSIPFSQRRFLAHELFHRWLGHSLREETGEGMVWFKEGFTDYMAARSLVEAKLADPAWFASYMIKLEERLATNPRRANPLLPSVPMRGDSDLDNLAYHKGALTAFALDVEMRARKQPGVNALLADLLATPEKRVGDEQLIALLATRQLQELESLLRAPALPAVTSLLMRIGFEEKEMPQDLTWFGIHLDDDTQRFGVVKEIAPDSPASRAGIAVGDKMGGYAPSREEAVTILPSVTTPFRYGLTLTETGRPVTFNVYRSTVEREIVVTPDLIPGGISRSFTNPPASEGIRAFFSTE